MRHSTRTFLALGKILLGLEDLCALEVPELSRPSFNARADKSDGRHELGVNIPLYNLCRDRRGLEAKLPANERLDLW